MNNDYQVIAFDMDGTLLTTDKKISADTMRAMQEAVEAGKQIILSTGRTDAELAAYVTAKYIECRSEKEIEAMFHYERTTMPKRLRRYLKKKQ